MSPNPSDPASSARPGGPTVQGEPLAALREGGGGVAALMTLLGRAQVTDEQRMLIELLVSLDNENEEESNLASDLSDNDADVRKSPDNPMDDRLELLQRELDDLREVNDTLAAALGACPLCWGGESNCPGCDGAGSSGSTPPNHRLFDELVGPAVVMMRTERRGGRDVGLATRASTLISAGGGDEER